MNYLQLSDVLEHVKKSFSNREDIEIEFINGLATKIVDSFPEFTKTQCDTLLDCIITLLNVDIGKNAIDETFAKLVITKLKSVTKQLSSEASKTVFLDWKQFKCGNVSGYETLTKHVLTEMEPYWETTDNIATLVTQVQARNAETNQRAFSKVALPNAAEIDDSLTVTKKAGKDNKKADSKPTPVNNISVQLELLSKLISGGSADSSRSKAWDEYCKALEVMIVVLYASKFTNEEIIQLLSLTDDNLQYIKLRLCLPNGK